MLRGKLWLLTCQLAEATRRRCQTLWCLAVTPACVSCSGAGPKLSLLPSCSAGLELGSTLGEEWPCGAPVPALGHTHHSCWRPAQLRQRAAAPWGGGSQQRWGLAGYTGYGNRLFQQNNPYAIHLWSLRTDTRQQRPREKPGHIQRKIRPFC